MARKYPRSLAVPSGSFFLFGVRGVGKSTWARNNLPDAIRFDLLDERIYHEFLEDPAAFGDLRTSRWISCSSAPAVTSHLK